MSPADSALLQWDYDPDLAPVKVHIGTTGWYVVEAVRGAAVALLGVKRMRGRAMVYRMRANTIASSSLVHFVLLLHQGDMVFCDTVGLIAGVMYVSPEDEKPDVAFSLPSGA